MPYYVDQDSDVWACPACCAGVCGGHTYLVDPEGWWIIQDHLEGNHKGCCVTSWCRI